ncbi:MAG: WD40 repeat domain-containing protein [Leptolyngbyaceae cyanobacterium bins.349]|nr:WD40 repeat domain-containing protein [Leptolyngbyaceae cyanobacterium bins.349]
MTPTEQPFKSLANAFVNPDATAVDRAEQLRRAELFLQDGTSGFTQLIRASLISENRNTRMVLVIDQFEEMFTLCQGMNAERDRHRFFQGLLTALRDLREQFSLVIVLRADFFSKCSFYSGLAEQIEQHLVMVTPLTYDQIKASILKPAEKVGLVCEPNLVYNILLDIVGAPGELPLLQYTLMELWQRREQSAAGEPSRLTLAAYAELGGVRGTLQKRANEIFYSLTPAEQRVAQRIFIALTQLGEGTEDTRRRVLKSELVSSQACEEVVERVLEKLVVAKLVVTNQITPTSGRQERVDQQFANVSTALRLAQVMKHKSAQAGRSTTLAQLSQMQTTLSQKYHLNVARLAQVNHLERVPVVAGNTAQETVDIAHEALIRNWGLLRSWLDENREMLRRQRRIERAAREWNLAHQERSPEYLLRGGRLMDAEDFWQQYPQELSSLAQRYITASKEENRRTRRELRLLKVTIPCTLMLAMGITFSQYRMATTSQAEKDYQLRVATSRQWSAIAQSLLQESDRDPMTALLISRLAAERGHTYEAEASLRAALQDLRLQAHWQVGQQPVRHIRFSPDQTWMATVEANSQLTLWSLKDRQVKRVLQPAQEANGVVNRVANRPAAPALAFSRDGKFLVANSSPTTLKVWSVETGEVQQQLGDFNGAIAHVAVSPGGNQVAASSGNGVKVWDMATGTLQSQGTHRSSITHLQFNGDGTRLLVADTQTVNVVLVQGYRPQAGFTPGRAIAAVSLSPDEQRVAIALETGSLQLWNVQTGKLQQSFPSLPPVAPSTGVTMPAQLHFSADGEHLARVSPGGTVDVMHLPSQQTWRLDQPADNGTPAATPPTVAIAFSPTNPHLVVAEQATQSRDRATASIRDLTTGKELARLTGHTDAIQAIQFSQDGSLIATAGADGAVKLWMAETGGEFPTLKLAKTPIQWASFQRPAGAIAGRSVVGTVAPTASLPTETLLALGENGGLRQWEMVNPRPIPSAVLGQLAQTPDSISPRQFNGEQLFKATQGWMAAFDQLSITSPLLSGAENPAAPPPSAGGPPALPNASLSRQTMTTLITTAAPESHFPQPLSPSGRLTGFAANGDKTLLAIANNQGLVEVWQKQPDQSLRRLHQLQAASPANVGAAPSTQGQSKTVHYLAFNPARPQLLGVAADKTILIWDLNSGETLHTLSGHEALIEQAHFSPDGSKIISASWDRTARLWDVRSGSLLHTFAQADVVSSAHFSPNHQRVFLTSLDGTARVIDAASGTLQVVLAGHRGAVLDGGFSPDGTLLATASADGTARLWDAHTGVERAILRVAKSGKSAIAAEKVFFSPSGHHLATLSSEGTVQVWAATWQGLLELARDRSLRQLTPDECLRYLRLTPNVCPPLAFGNTTPTP